MAGPLLKKLVVLGDGCVGKTSLLITKFVGKYPEEYIPTIFENSPFDMTDSEGRTCQLELFDTAGGEDYYRLRPLCYPHTDVFMVCFDLARSQSFQNVADHWVHEIDYFVPEAQRILVGCKSDLRPVFDDDPNMVRYSEGKELAKKWDMSYVELSALKMKGVEECFQEALRLVFLGDRIKPPARKFVLRRFRPLETPHHWETIDQKLDHPDRKPRKANPPPMTIEQSRFRDDWQSVKDHSLNTDIIIKLGPTHRLESHAIVLCCASMFFSDLLLPDNKKEQAAAEGCGVSKVFIEEVENRLHTVIELGPSVDKQAFGHFLNFLYSGDPKCPDDVDPSVLAQLTELSHTFQVPQLDQWCTNTRSGDLESNQCLADYWTETMGRTFGERFLNKEQLSDVKIIVRGRTIHAHRCVLMARSELLAAMFGQNFRESHSDVSMDDVDAESFLAVLQYLYTDHCHLQHVDAVSVLVLADRFCLPRLVAICERHLGDSVPGADTNSARENVISLTQTAKKYNAPQLVNWCLHHIAMDYAAYATCEAYCTLNEEDKSEIERNKWPPQWYIDECKRETPMVSMKRDWYMNRRTKKCVVM